MKTLKKGRTQRAGTPKLQPAKASSALNPAVLPLEELRQLVLQIILRDDIKPFLRRMVILLDSVKAGQLNRVTEVARQSEDPAFIKLMSVLSDAIQEGDLVGARITVLLAASYAYQESLDYYWELMSYLDRFREDESQ